MTRVQKQGASKYKGLGKKTNQNLKSLERQKQALTKCILKKSYIQRARLENNVSLLALNYGIGLPMGLLFCFINWIKES